MSIIDKLKEKGYDTVPAEFYTYIELWRSWYAGSVKDFHSYQVFNGMSHVRACSHKGINNESEVNKS